MKESGRNILTNQIPKHKNRKSLLDVIVDGYLGIDAPVKHKVHKSISWSMIPNIIGFLLMNYIGKQIIKFDFTLSNIYKYFQNILHEVNVHVQLHSLYVTL